MGYAVDFRVCLGGNCHVLSLLLTVSPLNFQADYQVETSEKATSTKKTKLKAASTETERPPEAKDAEINAVCESQDAAVDAGVICEQRDAEVEAVCELKVIEWNERTEFVFFCVGKYDAWIHCEH